MPRKRYKYKQILLFNLKGITLIEIPFWWDRTYESIAATTYSVRPELFSSEPGGTTIPHTLALANRKEKIPSTTSKLIYFSIYLLFCNRCCQGVNEPYYLGE